MRKEAHEFQALPQLDLEHDRQIAITTQPRKVQPGEAPQARPGLDLGNVSEWIMIEVADSGQGISDDLKERVLEPFFSTKERGKATGLGLSVTNRIVVSHGGVLQIANSEELGGAAIRVFLPLLAEDQPAAG